MLAFLQRRGFTSVYNSVSKWTLRGSIVKHKSRREAVSSLLHSFITTVAPLPREGTRLASYTPEILKKMPWSYEKNSKILLDFLYFKVFCIIRDKKLCFCFLCSSNYMSIIFI